MDRAVGRTQPLSTEQRTNARGSFWTLNHSGPQLPQL